MDASETRIAEIIQGITCRNVPLDENQLSGGLLFEEVIKLAAMTVGFYAAEQGGALYRQPYNEVRTQACLRQLMEFACKDSSEIVAAFCQEALKGNLSEEQLALRMVKGYMRAYSRLRECTSWNLPTFQDISAVVLQSIGSRDSSATLGSGLSQEFKPK